MPLLQLFSLAGLGFIQFAGKVVKLLANAERELWQGLKSIDSNVCLPCSEQ